jgi:hypothetical protein
MFKLSLYKNYNELQNSEKIKKFFIKARLCLFYLLYFYWKERLAEGEPGNRERIAGQKVFSTGGKILVT